MRDVKSAGMGFKCLGWVGITRSKVGVRGRVKGEEGVFGGW